MQAAYHIAYELGLPTFEMPWCIGLKEVDGNLLWIGSDKYVKDIPDDGECFLAQLPIRVIAWN